MNARLLEPHAPFVASLGDDSHDGSTFDDAGVTHIRTARRESEVDRVETWHERPRLLIGVSDDALASRCERFFAEQGFAVETSWSGLRCLELLGTWSPHAVILEADLLWGDGERLLTFLRSDPRFREVATLQLLGTRPSSRIPSPPPVVDTFGPPFDFPAMLETLAFEVPELRDWLAAQWDD